ncbi:M50 family metallopeptidase [Streptacidiphilus jiangxiensis]|uniref:Putative peptide zinc metalloprotease protein n=1 Tax=Streptacidiphilus jiangxiensis TaxID=235985 RepID=A0A1H8AV60_STRJI|nr:M50 family metallopeptidase [Streptacidiphilus jiangxiensis]SEM74632.1 putative peptide zinc metalloprotease protein [Streptacidiphilus jiangxiensis]
MEPVYTVRRSDGQVVELSQLLYHVVCAVDGVRTTEQVAARVSASYGRELACEDVEFLIGEKLRPLGVTVLAGDATAVPGDAPSSDLLLGLKGRSTLLPPRAVWALTGPLTVLHSPFAVLLVLAAFAVADGWLFFVHGAVSALADVMDQPGALLAVFVLAVASLVFHELGHASACRYGGARPGRIGFGIYLLWPSFFTDVTDIYRRPRADRLRTDLGGVYFNVVFMLALFAAYAATGQPLLLAAVYLGHYEVLEQLIPVVRLDGYYILADLAGVPDLFGQMRPVMRSVLRRDPTGVSHLTRRSRLLVTAWVLVSTCLLISQIASTLYHLPGIIIQAVTALADQARVIRGATASGDLLTACGAAVRFVFLLLPLAATLYLLLRLGKSLRRKLAASSRARNIAWALTVGAALGAVAATTALSPRSAPGRQQSDPVLHASSPGGPASGAPKPSGPTSSGSVHRHPVPGRPARSSPVRSTATPHGGGASPHARLSAPPVPSASTVASPVEPTASAASTMSQSPAATTPPTPGGSVSPTATTGRWGRRGRQHGSPGMPGNGSTSARSGTSGQP